MTWSWGKADEMMDPLLRVVIAAIEQIMSSSAGVSRAAIRPEAFLGADLGLSSIAVARLAGVLQKRYGGKPLQFHMLFIKQDGTMLQDVRVSDLVVFLKQQMSRDY